MPFHGYATDRFPNPATDRIVIERRGKRTAIGLPRHGVVAVFLLGLILLGWSLASGAYVLFHDTVVAELRRGAAASQKGYESQISTLRAELERTRTRRMVENTGVDQRITELGQRQAAIEQRQNRLAAIAEVVGADAGGASDPAFAFSMKPSPLGEPAHALDGLDPEPAGETRRESSIETTERVGARLDAVDANQARALESLALKTTERRQKLEQVYDAAGVQKPGARASGRARGGPFEPLGERATTFEARADQIEAERALLLDFERGLNRVPIRTPAPGASLSSNFGARVDPFLGRPAFHAGLDFEAEMGVIVKATAAGRVVAAGWTGGYGNMVEIDHGGGLSTRYGHLSAVLVSVGDQVWVGSEIGRVGSTGRSTGPHLHYETRVAGTAVNPLRFLNAGRILARPR